MQTPASYIQQSGVLEAPPRFPWKGKGMHYGPEQGTKLHDALEKITTCGIATVAALVVEWLAWRFHASKDIEKYLQYAEGTLAWEIDLRYRDESKFDSLMVDDDPIDQALGDAIALVRTATDDRLWTYPAAHAPSCAALISTTKQTLPDKQKKALASWLDFALPRAAKLTPAPRKQRPMRHHFDTKEAYQEALRPIFGSALPREALDPDAGYKPEQREELLSRFLENLNWKKNPFLRSPDGMKKLGFKGKPYKL